MFSPCSVNSHRSIRLTSLMRDLFPRRKINGSRGGRDTRSEVKYGLYSVHCTLTVSTRRAVLKVHKRENFLGSDIEICTFS